VLAQHEAQESTLFPVTTAGFVAFMLGALHILSLVVFFAMWSTPDEWIGNTPLTSGETVAAVISIVIGLASALATGFAMVMSGERAKVQYSVLALGIIAPVLMTSLLV
jgi:hypothetical protein